MDLDDLDEAPIKATSRVSKFAPKSSKLKPKPKGEPVPKPEPQSQPEPSISKSEPQEFVANIKKNEDGEETVPTTHIKHELNTTVPMETEPKSEHEGKEEPGRDDPMDEDNLEDTVVREIDVFFSPSVDAETKVRLKPESSEVELDLSIDLESSNIDTEFASKYNITKQTYATSWKPSRADGRAATATGLLMGNKLRPKLQHLNSGGSKRKSVVSAGANATVKIEGSNEEKSAATSKQNKQTEPSVIEQKNDGDELALVWIIPVSTVHLSASSWLSFNTKSIAPQTRPVYYFHMEVMTRPCRLVAGKSASSVLRVTFPFFLYWLPLKYHSCKSDISSGYLQQMVTQESSPINFTMKAYDYVTALCPGGTSNNLPKGPSKRDLLSLPVEERLKKMLEKYPPQRFSALKHFAPEYSEEELLQFLQQHAILLWGLWTAKSSLLFPNGGAESLARDYVLLLFSKNLKVHSSDFNVRGELTTHVKDFLKLFGLETSDIDKSAGQPNPYWKFKQHPDESFKKLYPDIVEKQENLFKSLEQHLPGIVSNVGKRKLGKRAVANQGVNSEPLKSESSDQRVTSLGGVSTGKMTMSNETRHALPIALKKLFQTHKVCSFKVICQGLREMAVSKAMLSKGDSKIAVDAAHSLDGPQNELMAVISEVACEIHGSYVLKSSQDDPFRDVVIDMLRGSGPNAKLKKAEILEAARRKLGREVPNNEYNKVMSELCVSKGSVWVLRSGDGINQ
ncbi:unnamed protein product [Sphenostylis stenocarpa]|uniref:DNA-directed RNA polymerase III subunit RPC5 n=1 Tax=Sphenostylis stenocarpa TaxID=92480 RepID=A0AA86RSG8_9FABA|nr:unnamed protein product [Sphenostylis stenocarpa]